MSENKARESAFKGFLFSTGIDKAACELDQEAITIGRTTFNAGYDLRNKEVEELKKEVRVEGKAKSVAQELIKWHQSENEKLKKEIDIKNARIWEFENKLILINQENQKLRELVELSVGLLKYCNPTTAIKWNQDREQFYKEASEVLK